MTVPDNPTPPADALLALRNMTLQMLPDATGKWEHIQLHNGKWCVRNPLGYWVAGPNVFGYQAFVDEMNRRGEGCF